MYPSADNYDAMATVDCGDCCIFGLRVESDQIEIRGEQILPTGPGILETYWFAFYYPYMALILLE